MSEPAQPKKGPGGARLGAGRKPDLRRADLQAQVRQYVGERLQTYLDELHRIALSKAEATPDRLRALKELLDSGLGRPIETSDLTDGTSTESDLPELDDTEWEGVGIAVQTGRDGS